MNRTLGEHHLMLANNTKHARGLRVSLCERSTLEVWTSSLYKHREFLDFNSAISGDDLARINAFEPYRVPSLWADVLEAA